MELPNKELSRWRGSGGRALSSLIMSYIVPERSGFGQIFFKIYDNGAAVDDDVCRIQLTPTPKLKTFVTEAPSTS